MAKDNEVLFDTNVWLGLFMPADSLHQRAVQLKQEYITHVKIVPEYVLLETLTLIKLYATNKEVQQCVDLFLDSSEVHVLPAIHVYDKTITLFQTLNDRHLSFVDMSLLALSRDYEVRTFDKKLATAIKRFNK